MAGESAKRGHIRFFSESNYLVWISKNCDEFEPEVTGLADTESHTGVGVIVVRNPGLEVGDHIITKVGELSPRKSVIRWVNEVDSSVSRIGIEYIED